MLITLYDTTLRDGAQGEGVNFSTSDKIKIIKALDNLGVHFIEAGYPGSNPKDQEIFREAVKIKLNHSQITAFGSTIRAGSKAADDTGLAALLDAGTKYVTIFGKSSEFQVKEILRVSLAENLQLIDQTIRYLIKAKKKVFYDAEHFFDGYLANPGYALKTLLSAEAAGAQAIILCDTNCALLPWQISTIVKSLKRKLKVPIGIHCHNDSGVSVANSLMAVQAGATQVQGTINGLGERTGNADILQLIANLVLKMKQPVVTIDQLKLLTYTSRLVNDILNLPASRSRPFVGLNAFAHKGGMHIDGVAKTGGAGFEHIDPAAVGNERQIIVSELSGRATVVAKINNLLPKLKVHKNSPEVMQIYQALKLKESQGYQYEAAEASFELLVTKILGKYKPHFQIKYYDVSVEGVGSLIAQADKNNLSQVTARIVITDAAGKEYFARAVGNGPIDALSKAFHVNLSKIYPASNEINLSDYKIKVLDGPSGSAAVARVWIEFRSGRLTWATVAVDSNIIHASLQALAEGLEYGLKG